MNDKKRTLKQKFMDAGSIGFYGETVADVAKKRGLEEGVNPYHTMSAEEKSAYWFFKTQTEALLKKTGIRDEETTLNLHFTVGKKISTMMVNVPEDLAKKPVIE